METAEAQEIIDTYLSRLVLAKDLKPGDRVEVSGYDRAMSVNSIKPIDSFPQGSVLGMLDVLGMIDKKYTQIVFFDHHLAEFHVQYYREDRIFNLA